MTDDLLARAAAAASEFRASLPDRPVAGPLDAGALRDSLDAALRDGPTPADQVLDEFVTSFDPGVMASAGPRYFGFVTGGSLDAAAAAEIVAVGWDQCGFNHVMSPAAVAAEWIAGDWLKELLGLPASASVGFVTGGQQANTVGLLAGRHQVLASAGWDVERSGLAGAPRVSVVAGEERHATIDRSMRLLGLGNDAVAPVAADSNGAIDLADLERVLASTAGSPTIVCLQAGNVNTGAVDDLRRGCAAAARHGAWVHVDGAFGLWGAASPRTRHLLDGVELADSWACDGHKWLNVPYDSGFVFCAHPEVHVTAASYTASYLVGSGSGAPAGGGALALESSRRARGFATWAALRELGRSGVSDLVERCCVLARRFASGLSEHGVAVANDVVLNQVLVHFGDDARTDRVIERVQQDGTCWLGGTTWRGRRHIRIAVSNWATTEADVDRSVAAILRAAAED